jgi:hypothetical protein
METDLFRQPGPNRHFVPKNRKTCVSQVSTKSYLVASFLKENEWIF